MIAEVELKYAGEKVRASLNDDGKWKCDDKHVEIVLNASYDPTFNMGPEKGFPGVRVVMAAVRRYGGRVISMQQPQDDDDIVY